MSAPRVTRSKTMELTSIGPDRYRLSGRLTDASHDGRHGEDCVADAPEITTEPGSPVLIHDFLVEGELSGRELVLSSLQVSTRAHPYGVCPAILPKCQALVGKSLIRGWRATVLETLGATAGCTHVTTLLLGLAEVRTMAIFLQMNRDVEYSPQKRDDGRWAAKSMRVAPGVVGACHALAEDGPVIASGRSNDASREGIDADD